jgi:amidohydrolase
MVQSSFVSRVPKVLIALCLGVGGAVTAFAGSEALLERAKVKTAEISGELIEIRRQIHMNPELSGQEEKTAALVAKRLQAIGLEVQTGVGGHGVVGVLTGGKRGPVVAYRADMDAVPSPVVGDPPYKSRVPNVKHVCGHDAHVAVGLGIAEVLASVREDLPGTVKFIFQPAEENVEGAQAMIDDGVLDDPAPQAIFGIHTVPWSVGTIVCPLGVGLTGWDMFEARLSADADVEAIADEALKAVMALSTVEPLTSADGFKALMRDLVVEDGPYKNFIYVQPAGPPSLDEETGELMIRGQIRAAGPASYARAREQLKSAIADVTKERARFELSFGETRFPDMHSDRKLVQSAIAPIEEAIGEGNAVMMYGSAPFFGEDFALFQQRIPGAMFFLGVANEEKGIAALNHFPDYDIDERAIEVGTVAMSNVLLSYLAAD